MKRFTYYTPLAFIAFATMTLTSCDNIAEDDRLLEYEKPPVERSIVIFEFTGQMCRNCPDGAAAVHNILESNPGMVYAINLHPENTTYTKPLGGLQLTSPAATFLYNYYQPMAFPAACINGQEPVNNTFAWSGDADNQLALPAPATLKLSTQYDEVSRKLTVNYTADFDTYITTEVLIQLYLVEDGIVGMQQSTAGLIRDYVHNHVLRTTLFPDWGQSLGDLFEVHQQVSGEASIELDENWVADNCSVVGCLIKNADKSFMQTDGIDSITDSNSSEE